ncbi:hypothetical protein ACOSQ3_016436 [Xanthoceras sorbifolium]
MKDCLDTFCGFSGQQVSFSKSQVLYSNNVRDYEAKCIARVCGSPITKDLGKYYGITLIHGRTNKNTYQEILEKSHKRLASCKSSSLSIAGARLQKAVLH